jgi:uncharacterized protein (TIGR03066 family)
MIRTTKSVVLGIKALCLTVVLASSGTAQAQTTKESVQGTWTTSAAGGFSSVMLQFKNDGTFHVVYVDLNGKKVEDVGRYSVVANTVLTTGSAGDRARLFFFWMNADAATIRLVPEGATRAVEYPFVRIR